MTVNQIFDSEAIVLSVPPSLPTPVRRGPTSRLYAPVLESDGTLARGPLLPFTEAPAADWTERIRTWSVPTVPGIVLVSNVNAPGLDRPHALRPDGGLRLVGSIVAAQALEACPIRRERMRYDALVGQTFQTGFHRHQETPPAGLRDGDLLPYGKMLGEAYRVSAGEYWIRPASLARHQEVGHALAW